MDNKEPVQLSINCAKCGATNKFMSDNIPMFCSFCGATLPDMSKHIDEAISMQRERERHEMAKEKDRDYVVAVFSGIVSFAALIVALVALLKGVG